MSRLANKPKFSTICTCVTNEEDLGLTEIERDEDVEGLPYLVSDDNYPCPNHRGASSRAPVDRGEVFPRPIPSLTSSQLPIGSDDEDDIINLSPQGRGKGPRNVTTDLGLVLRTLTKLGIGKPQGPESASDFGLPEPA